MAPFFKNGFEKRGGRALEAAKDRDLRGVVTALTTKRGAQPQLAISSEPSTSAGHRGDVVPSEHQIQALEEDLDRRSQERKHARGYIYIPIRERRHIYDETYTYEGKKHNYRAVEGELEHGALTWNAVRCTHGKTPHRLIVKPAHKTDEAWELLKPLASIRLPAKLYILLEKVQQTDKNNPVVGGYQAPLDSRIPFAASFTSGLKTWTAEALVAHLVAAGLDLEIGDIRLYIPFSARRGDRTAEIFVKKFADALTERRAEHEKTKGKEFKSLIIKYYGGEVSPVYRNVDTGGLHRYARYIDRIDHRWEEESFLRASSEARYWYDNKICRVSAEGKLIEISSGSIIDKFKKGINKIEKKGRQIGDDVKLVAKEAIANGAASVVMGAGNIVGSQIKKKIGF